MNTINEKIIKRLTVKITSTQSNEAGTGFILYQPHLADKIYVLTAKHCLCGSEFNFEPDYKSLSFEMNIGDSIVKYQLKKEDEILINEENDPDIAIIVINKENIDNEAIKVPLMDVVIDRSELQGCVIGGYPNEFSLKSVKSIQCSFDLTADDNKIELSPQSSIETVEFDDNLSSIQGMSGGAVCLENKGDIFFHGIVDTFGGWQRFTGSTAKTYNDLLLTAGQKELVSINLELDKDIISAINQLGATTKEEVERRNNKNKIGDLHLDRTSLVEDVESALNEAQIVVIHGNAGVGKSIISSELLEKQKGSRSIFVFRADELLNGTLTQFLTEKGVNCSLDQILDSPILLSEKVIYVDAVENILEAQSFDAIESLLALSKERKDLKILISIRSKYNDNFIAMLATVLPSRRAFVEVPHLSEEEIDIIQIEYDWVKQLFNNVKIADLLKTPFYLNHTISLSNAILSEGEISKRHLIIKLWQKIVVSNNPFREGAFEKIVVDRAKAMKPYIKPEFIENAVQLIGAVSELHTDEVVISDEDDYGDSCYAPSHDIFQDWALIRHVNSMKVKIPELSDFLNELGNELAIRRGFRLWMSDQLDLELFNHVIDEFVIPTNSDWEGGVYWRDEIVLSILKSEHLESFVHACEEQLLDNKATLFKRFVRLLLIVSQPMRAIGEKQQETFIDSELENAWQVLVEFLNKNYSDVQAEFDWVISFFDAWNKRTKIELIGNDGNTTLNQLCKSVMLTRESSNSDDSKKDRRVLLETFINSGVKSSNDLETLINSAIEFEAADEKFRQEWRGNPEKTDRPKADHELRSYFKDILKRIKSGQDSVGLCYLFPEKILKYIFDNWKQDDLVESEADPFSYRSDSIETEFGLSDRYENKYFPASPYQTSVLNLLRFYPIETIKSICEFFNFATEKYKEKKSAYRNDQIVTINFNYGDDQEKQLVGSSLLWSIFRGTGQTSPYLLQSLLMALEKHLLKLSKGKDEVSKLQLERAFSVIYEVSNTVSPFAVIASVSMAHEQPVSISKFILPLFQVKDFFNWEINRFTSEFSALSPIGDTPIIQNERHESNQLPHRKEYLERFVIRLSMTIMFKEITEILDKFYEERTVDNDNWSLALNRMDVRKFEIVEHPLKNQIELKPKLDKALEVTVKKYEEESSGMHSAMASLNWTVAIISKGDVSNNEFKTWKNYFETVKRGTKRAMFDSSAGVAFIGLKYHFEAMTDLDIEMCTKIILDSVVKTIVLNELGKPVISNSTVYNKEPTLLALPELFNVKTTSDDEVKELIIYAVFGLDLSSGIDLPIFEKLARRLWQINPDFAKNVFRGLYRIKEVDDRRPQFGYVQTKETKIKANEYAKEVKDFYDSIGKSELEAIDIGGLKLDLNELDYLKSLLHFIPDNVRLEDEQLNFLLGYTELLQESTLVKFTRRDSEPYEIKGARSSFEQKFARLVLNQPEDRVVLIFNKTFDFVSDGKGKYNDRFDLNLFQFMDGCLKAIIIEQDQREDSESFWIVWNVFYKWQQERVPLFTGKLLLNISWKDTAVKWKSIEGRSQFFIKVIEEGDIKLEGYVVKLISRIGFEEMGVILISKMAELVRKHGFGNVNLEDSELWMQRLFTLKRVDVISSSEILCDVLYILDLMVDQGSSVALHIRDVLISYLRS